MARRLLILNGLATLAAVIYHASGWGYTAMFWWADRYRAARTPDFADMGSAGYYVLRLLEQAAVFGMPAFLFVSGFFVAFSAGRRGRNAGWGTVARRMAGLALPFALWSLLILGLRAVEGARFSFAGLLVAVATGQATPAYYYIPVLVQLYALSWILVPYARRQWKLVLLASAAVQGTVMILRYVQVLQPSAGWAQPAMFLARSWFFPGYLFWFALGVVIGFHWAPIKAALSRIRPLLPFLAAAGLVAGMLEWEWLLAHSGREWIGTRETLLDGLFIVAVLLGYLSWEGNLPFAESFAALGTRSYGVYLIHLPILEVTARSVYHWAPALLAYPSVFLPLLVLAGLAMPLLLMDAVERSPARRYYRLAFG